MKSGQCPICKSMEVYTNDTVNFRASGQILALENEDGEDELEVSFAPYICSNCGFTALYVEDMNDIKNLSTAKGWKRVR